MNEGKKSKKSKISIIQNEPKESLEINNSIQLHDLEKIEILGTGTFGKVYLVRHINNLRYFAMKILKKSTVVRLKQVQHIYNERDILLKVEFPFIVNL